MDVFSNGNKKRADEVYELVETMNSIIKRCLENGDMFIYYLFLGNGEMLSADELLKMSEEDITARLDSSIRQVCSGATISANMVKLAIMNLAKKVNLSDEEMFEMIRDRKKWDNIFNASSAEENIFHSREEAEKHFKKEESEIFGDGEIVLEE